MEISIEPCASVPRKHPISGFSKRMTSSFLLSRELKLKQEAKAALKTANERKAQLEYNLNNLGSAIDRKVMHAGMVQSKQAQPRFDVAERTEKRLETYIDFRETDVDRMPDVIVFVEEIKHYHEQVRDLQKHEGILKLKAESAKTIALEKKTIADEKRRAMQEALRENFELTLKLMHLENEYQNSQRSPKKPKTTYARGFSLRTANTRTISTEREIMLIRCSTQDLVHQQSSHFQHARDLEIFFEACIDSSNREFLRLQQLTHKKTGLRNSLYLESLQRNRPQPWPCSSELVRSRTAALHDPVKSKESTKSPSARHFMRNSMPAGKLLGEVLIDPELREVLHRQIFPANVLCVRPSTTACSPRSQVSTSGTMSTSPRNRILSPR